MVNLKKHLPVMSDLEDFTLSMDDIVFHCDPDWKDYYVLMKALRYGQKEIVKSLIQKGARVNRFEADAIRACTPLHLAVILGCPEIVELLLDKGAFISVKNNNHETPLIMAAKMGKDQISDLLLSATDEENQSNRENLSHLHIACMRNRVDVVRKLLQYGAKINDAVGTHSARWRSYTPLHFAVEFQCIETVQFLVNHGADITATDIIMMTPLHLANILRNEIIIDTILSTHKHELTNPTDWGGVSHFHIACTRNNPAIVESFLQQGVDINENVDGDSVNWPSYRPINFAIEYECTDVVKLLVLHGAILNFDDSHCKPIQYAHGMANKIIIDSLQSQLKIRLSNTGINKLSDFHDACVENDERSIQNLLQHVGLMEKPTDVNSPIWSSVTPLHLAVKHKTLKVTKLLLKHGANITVQNAKGQSPLHLAFRSDQLEIVDSILLAHLNVHENPVDGEGLSHFHISCSRSHLKIVKNFLENGVNINSPVPFDSTFWPGYTPLHFAIKFEQNEVVKLLLEHDANITAKNKMDSTPLDMAITMDDFTIIDLILSAASFRKIDSFDDRGLSHLHAYCVKNDTNAIERFLKSHPNEINKSISWAESGWNGYTPLHLALHFGSEEAIELLLKKGADTSRKCAVGNTPWHLMNDTSFHQNNYNHITTMWNNENSVGEDGFSEFHVACCVGNAKAVEYFLKNGVDVNQPTTEFDFTNNTEDCTAQSPLHLAVWNKKVCKEVIELLLKNGAYVNTKDGELNTPLHYTECNSNTNALELLLCHGADVNAQNMYGETPLVVNCPDEPEVGTIQKIVFLLANGADMNIEDETGNSPLSILDSWSNVVQDKIECAVFMMKHMKKLEMINYYVSGKNKEYYLKLSKENKVKRHYNEIDFIEQCSEELNKMKAVNLDNYTTLYSILRKTVNEMAWHTKNSALREIVNSADFHKEFPIYGFLLELQFKKGLTRRPLLESSKKPLNILTKHTLHHACLEIITQYLSNEDLQNIILSK